MILVVGGIASGKRTYVAQQYGFQEQDMADGVLDDKPVVFNTQDLVRTDPARALELVEPLLQKQVVICNEVGSGVIPVSPEERRGREATGRLCNALTLKADKVVRLVCGIPTTIKG